jgi:tRNA (guanine37-N1)-methyltransferase
MEQAALEYLQRDRLLHIDMLELLRLNEAEALYAGEDGALIHLAHGDIYMLSATSKVSAAKIASQITNASMLVLHQPYLREELMARFSLTGCMPCYQAAWLSDAPVPPLAGDFDIRSLTQADLPFVHAHYDNISDEEYLLERLGAGMLGVYVEGELAGFIGTHTEGTIGLLEILPAYRRRGLAFALEGAMMRRQQALGRVPYAQIKEGNEASLQLHRKLGMEITPEASVLWLY